jgi:hypothetical protein
MKESLLKSQPTYVQWLAPLGQGGTKKVFKLRSPARIAYDALPAFIILPVKQEFREIRNFRALALRKCLANAD